MTGSTDLSPGGEQPGTGRRGLWSSISSRTGLDRLLGFLAHKSVPRHAHSAWYLFGGLALFFLVVQLLSGLLLALEYSPNPASANESVHAIVERIPFGWLVRSIHGWGANLMVAVLLIHFFSTFFLKAYRAPREAMWVTGVLLLMLVLGFAFTGYLLPWDSTAYFATQIGTEIPRSIPVIGELVVSVLRGGEYIAEESLRRMFALHAIILPVLALTLVLLHLILNQIHGSSIPAGASQKGPGIPFYPNYLFRDAMSWASGLFVLLALTLIFPIHVGAKVDPLASAPVGIKPEWYFLTLFQTLRMLPGEILGVNSELVVNVAVALLGAALLAIPFIDREGKSRVLPLLGAAGIVYMAVAITLAYLT